MLERKRWVRDEGVEPCTRIERDRETVRKRERERERERVASEANEPSLPQTPLSFHPP